MRAENQGRPPIEDLTTFCLLVSLGEMKQVAERLGIDVSAVSRRLKPFQQRHGLLARKGSTWALTERGREALPVIERLVRDHETLTSWLADKAAAPESLVVATGSWGAVWLLPAAIARLRKNLPAVEVHVRVCRGRDRILGVRDGTIDLAIVSHEGEQIRALIGAAPVVIEELASESLVLLAAVHTPAGARLASLDDAAPIPLSMLSEFEMVGLDERSGVRRQLEAALRVTGAKLPHFGTGSGGWLAAREHARLGLGVALVPGSVLKQAGHEGLVVRRLDAATVRVRQQLLYRENTDRESLRVFAAALRQAASRG